MDSCHSGDHIAEDHTHTDITACNIEELEQKYQLGALTFYWVQTLAVSETFGLHDGFLAYQ